MVLSTGSLSVTKCIHVVSGSAAADERDREKDSALS